MKIFVRFLHYSISFKLYGVFKFLFYKRHITKKREYKIFINSNTKL